MATLAKLVVKLITDVSEFEAGMKAASKKMTKIGDEMTKVGGALTVGVTLPLAVAGGAAIKFASDLNESTNKVQVVFGDASKAVEDFAKTAATKLGMSSQEALEAAGTFGNLFTTMGMGDKASADMSTSLLTLSADLASFNNLDPALVLEKLRSGLVGETEPLKSMGILINDAMLKAKALKMGLGGVNGVLTDSEKVQVRYALIMEQTSKAQGDFARTSDGLANSTRITNALFKDTLASFGQQLLPLAVKAMQLLIPILQFFNNLPAPVKTVIIVFAGLAAALGPVLVIAGQLIGAFTSIAGLLGTGGALAGAGAFITTSVIPALTGVATAITGTVIPAIVAIGLPVIALVAAIGLLIFVIQKFGAQAWQTILDIGKIFGLLPKLIGPSLASVGTAISNMLKGAWQTIKNWSSNFYNAGQALMAGFVKGIVSWATTLIQTVLSIVQAVIDAVKRLLGISSPSKVMGQVGKNMMLGLESGIKQFSGRPIQATLQASGAFAGSAATGGMATGGARGGINIGPITFNGDLSESQRLSLEEWFSRMVENELVGAMKGMA